MAGGILDGLNDAQREAVTHDTGPLLIVAGAGTGKTTVITRRIAHLIAQGKARPEEILALTFTDKAAAEMEARVDELVPYGYADVEIATFHAFGDALLRGHSLEIGLQNDFSVLSRAEQVIFLRDRLFDLPLARYRPLGDPTRYLQSLITLFSRCKDEDIAPAEYLACAARLRSAADDYEKLDRASAEEELSAAYAKYHELMARHDKIDFGDQIVLALRLLRARPHVLNAYQRRFKYVLVDEFQDTNYAQFELVKLLAARHGNVAVTGDDDQAIYRFRGAAISNVLSFLRHYPDARQIVVTENFRSHQAILDAAYTLIQYNNPDRLEVESGIVKRLTAVREAPGPLPRHWHYDTATQEADSVAQTIRERVEVGEWSYDDVAILVRSNDDADAFLRALNLRGVPWTFSGNAGLYGRPEVRLLLAFLRAVAHPDDSVSVHYLASSDLYQVPIVDLTRCATHADRKHRWLFDVLRDADQIPELAGELSEEARGPIRHLVRYMELGREMPTGELLYQFLVDSGWLARMSKAVTARDEAEVQNISKFFRRIQDASKALKYDNVREFVKHLEALIDAGEDPAVAEADVETPAVRVLTVHKAKGLEFPVVFLVHLVQGKFPTQKRRDALELPAELLKDVAPTGDFHAQEERRLFYVGMTRARRELILTSARDYGGARERKVSQFVLEALDLPRDAARPFKGKAVEEIERFAPPAARDEAALPPIPADEEITISHKQVDDYQTCPLKYRYVHQLRVPILRHHSLVYGSTIHEVVEFYLSGAWRATTPRSTISWPSTTRSGSTRASSPGSTRRRARRPAARRSRASGTRRRAPARSRRTSRRTSPSASGRLACAAASTAWTRICSARPSSTTRRARSPSRRMPTGAWPPVCSSRRTPSRGVRAPAVFRSAWSCASSSPTSSAATCRPTRTSTKRWPPWSRRPPASARDASRRRRRATPAGGAPTVRDRKSTRLNSSHSLTSRMP